MVSQPPAGTRTTAKKGLQVAWLQSKPTVVQREHTYTAYIDAGSLDVQDNAISTMTGLIEIMLAEGKKLGGAPAK